MQDRVVVLGRLGEGATGVVYRAFDLLDLRLVAVKVIPVHDQSKRRQLVHELSSLFDGIKRKERRTRARSADIRNASSGSIFAEFGAAAVAAASANRRRSWAMGGKSPSSRWDSLANCNQSGSENLLDFIDAFVSREAATLSLVVEYMDGGSLQVRNIVWDDRM